MQNKKCKPFTNHMKEINTHIYIERRVINCSIAPKHVGHQKDVNCSTAPKHAGQKKKSKKDAKLEGRRHLFLEPKGLQQQQPR